MTINDQTRAQKTRAARLREAVREVTSGNPEALPPRTPREFIDEKMREEGAHPPTAPLPPRRRRR